MCVVEDVGLLLIAVAVVSGNSSSIVVVAGSSMVVCVFSVVLLHYITDIEVLEASTVIFSACIPPTFHPLLLLVSPVISTSLATLSPCWLVVWLLVVEFVSQGRYSQSL